LENIKIAGDSFECCLIPQATLSLEWKIKLLRGRCNFTTHTQADEKNTFHGENKKVFIFYFFGKEKISPNT
jgi:hypothetical protein